MRWATCQLNGDSDIRVGRVVGDDVYLLAAGVALRDLLGDDGERLERAGDHVIASPERVIGLADARLLPPIPRPPTVRDFYAFERHVRVGAERRGSRISPEWYQLPVFYFTNPYALVGHGEPVAPPPGASAAPPVAPQEQSPTPAERSAAAAERQVQLQKYRVWLAVIAALIALCAFLATVKPWTYFQQSNTPADSSSVTAPGKP